MPQSIVITNPDEFQPEGGAAPAPASIVITKPEAFVPEGQPGPWRDEYQTPAAPNLPRLPDRSALPRQPPSKVTAGILGFGQGATGGWLDELAAGVATAGISNPMAPSPGRLLDAHREQKAAGGFVPAYEKRRDAMRAEEAAAREAHPGIYHGTQIAGAIAAPGPKGVIANAIMGGAYGAGASEAEDIGGVAKDALLGGSVAGAAGGIVKGTGAAIKKVIGGAPARVERRATDALLEGTPAKTVQDPALAALGGKAGLTKGLKEEGLIGKPASKIDAALKERMDDVGGRLGAIYQRADETAPGVPPEYVRDKLMALAQKFRSDPDSAEAVRSYANRLAAEYTDEGAISAQELHKVVKVLGHRGFDTNPMNPSMSSALKREIRGEVLGVLQQHVDDVSKGAGDAGALSELRNLNQQYRRLINMDNIAASKAKRDERVSPTLGQRAREVVSGVANLGSAGGAIAALASGEPTLAAASVAAGAAVKYAPQLAAAADRLAANVADSTLANYLRTAGTVQELLARAVRIGIPREAAMQAIGAPGTQPEQEPLPAVDSPLLVGR
jgi:hypothetical protein